MQSLYIKDASATHGSSEFKRSCVPEGSWLPRQVAKPCPKHLISVVQREKKVSINDTLCIAASKY